MPDSAEVLQIRVSAHTGALHVLALADSLAKRISAILILSPYVLMTGGVNLGDLSGSGWINLLIVGLFHTGVTYCMYFSSLRELPGQEAAILSYMDPLVAVIVSVAFLNESITGFQIIGGALSLGFATLNETGARQ